jgi:hypothetical protein
MSTRDLRVRFVGDASGLKSSFAEANAASSGFSTGVGKAATSSESAGKSITRTGKLFRASGKFIKSSGLDAAAASTGFLSTIPALSGMSSSMGALVTQATALSPVLAGLSGPVGLGLLAAGAAAVGAAFILMKDDVETATAALNRMGEANQWVKDSHVQVARAAVRQKEAVEGLEDAQLAQRQASLSLWQAQHDLAEIAKENGKNSLEYRQALLRVKQAEDSVSDARRSSINQAQEVIRLTERRSKATQDETAQVRRMKAEAEKLEWGLKNGLITGKDREAASRKVRAALNAEAGALNKAASRHRANATEARNAAKALRGDASPAVQQLRQNLIELANTEAGLGDVTAAMNGLATAAGFAANQVRAAVAAIAAIPSTVQAPRVVGGSGNLVRRSKRSDSTTPGMKSSDSLEMGRRRGIIPRRGEVNPLSFTDIVGGIIGTRHRDDSLQDKVAGSKARSKARGAGIENPDKLDAISEKAVAELRKKELQADIRTTQNQRKKLRGRIGDLRKRLASQRASRRKAKKDDQPKWDSAIQDTIGRIRGLWDEDRAMARDINEMRAEAKELGYDIGRLDDTIGGLPNAVPDEAEEAAKALGPASPEDFLDAAAAEAALTPDVGDDIAVAEQAVAHFGRGLDAARAGGDPRAIAAAAQALLAARNNLDQLKATRDNTDALNANTAAVQGFGGSSTFSYRGQDYTLRSLAPPSSDRLVEATI